MALVMMAILARSEYCSLRCRVNAVEREGFELVGLLEPEAGRSAGEVCLETSIGGIQ